MWIYSTLPRPAGGLAEAGSREMLSVIGSDVILTAMASRCGGRLTAGAKQSGTGWSQQNNLTVKRQAGRGCHGNGNG